jgi:hypothetical protein
MRDGRRIVAADEIKHEVKRREDQESPNAGNPKYNLCEFHLLSPVADDFVELR